MKSRGLLLGLLTALALLAACGEGGRPSVTPTPARGKIAFQSFRINWPGPPAHPIGELNPSDIYLINADGTGLTNLTNYPAGYQSLAWSPDGMRLAFSSDRDGNWEIYVMNSDGTGLTNLTNSPSQDFAPIWAPGGTEIAFVTGSQLFLIHADGSGLTRLVDNVAIHAACPLSWSPDGLRIVFTSGPGNFDIYVVNVDGSGLTRLTEDPTQDWCPSFSPDGQKILFQRGEFPPTDIFMMNADGSGVTNLTNTGYRDINTDRDELFPVWSPDGTRIIFDSNDIYVMNADGSKVTRLTQTPLEEEKPLAPAWSPDGSYIAYELEGDIYVMNADGSGKTNLTNSPAIDRFPVWAAVQYR